MIDLIKRFFVFVLFSILITGITSCSNLNESESTGIYIALPFQDNSRSVFHKKEEIKTIQIVIKSNSKTVIDEKLNLESNSNTTSKFYELEEGVYTVSLTAFDKENQIIGEGTTSAEVKKGITTNAEILLKLKETVTTGTGTTGVIGGDGGNQQDPNFTYASDFLSTKFYYVRDVQWNPDASTASYVRGPDVPWGLEIEMDSSSYIKLEVSTVTTQTRNGMLGYNGDEKNIPLYNAVLYNSEDKMVRTLRSDILIVGICNYGMMTVTDQDELGAFFYTQSGWTAAQNSGKEDYEILCDYTIIFPTITELSSLHF